MKMFYVCKENGGDLEKILQDQRMVYHVKRVMDAITNVVNALDNMASLVSQLKRIGGHHAKFKVKNEHFKVSKRAYFACSVINLSIYY